jgi:hypothetical protein
MALTWVKFEGFEDNNYGLIQPFGSADVVSTAPRSGTYEITISGNITLGWLHGWVLPVPNLDRVFMQYGVRQEAGYVPGNDASIFQWRNPLGVLQGELRTSENNLAAYIGNKATLAGVTSTPIASSYTLFEIELYLHDTNGILKIWVNGNLEVNYSGNTLPASATTIASFRHGNYQTGSGTSRRLWFDDIAIGDDRLYGAGFHKIGTLTQGHYDQWTPVGDTDALDCITPVPPSMDKYIKTTTDGHKQSFGHTGYTPAGGIGAVIARHYGQGGGQVTLGRRHNSTDYMEVAPVGLPGAFGVLDQIYFEKPGGGAWDKTTLDATEFIIEAEIPA